MTCDEAQELFGLISDLNENDPRWRQLEMHMTTCSDCAAEFDLWMESHSYILELQEEASEEKAEEINRNVMTGFTGNPRGSFRTRASRLTCLRRRGNGCRYGLPAS